MKILSTGSLYGDKQKYTELYGLVKHLKPEVLVITGDLFPSTPENPFLQSDFIDDFTNFIKTYSNFCDRVFYIFGEEDCMFLENITNDIILNETKNTFNLNHVNVNYNDFTFIGLPYVKDGEHLIKDWVRTDKNSVNINDKKSFIIKEDMEIFEIEDNYDYIKFKPSLSDVIEDKLKDTLKNKILISHYPPMIENFYSEENYIEYLNDYLENFSNIYCGHSNYNKVNHDFKTRVKNTNIFKHNDLNKMLLYNFNIIKNGKLKYSYYPLNNDVEEIQKNTFIYKEINDVK
jgi:Icc-related predicted phosphoesterase